MTYELKNEQICKKITPWLTKPGMKGRIPEVLPPFLRILGLDSVTKLPFCATATSASVEQHSLRYGSVALTVQRRGAKAIERVQMFRRAVALVARQSVAGINRVEFHHQPVAKHLGQHTRRGDRLTSRVALDYGLLRAWPIDGVAPVDEQIVGQQVIRRAASCSTAMRIASNDARRILMRSMVSTSTAAMAHAWAHARISASKALRCFSVSCFESVKPGRRQPWGRMTAAATTGPKIGPRPTSSSPAMRSAPRRLRGVFERPSANRNHADSIRGIEKLPGGKRASISGQTRSRIGRKMAS